jgi:hypothetical protein
LGAGNSAQHRVIRIAQVSTEERKDRAVTKEKTKEVTTEKTNPALYIINREGFVGILTLFSLTTPPADSLKKEQL